MKFRHIGWVMMMATLATSNEAGATTYTFNYDNGTTHPWNDPANWTPPTDFPKVTDDVAIVPAATGALTINLGASVTVGQLDVNKGSGNITTTIGVGTTNTLTFDGGTSKLSNGLSASATGLTTVAAPIVFGPSMPSSTFTISQAGPSTLQLTGGISGTGNLSVTRDANGSGTVVLGAANSYVGTTTLTGQTGANWLVVRLDDANSIPGGIGATGGTSNLTLTNSVIIGLSASDFTRAIGTGADQFQNVSVVQSGWAAFGQDRAVKICCNLIGDPNRVIWGSSGANFSTLVLGHATADKTIDFQNILDLNTGTGSVNRTIRVLDGAAAIDAKISGPIVVGQGTGNLAFNGGGGTLSLTAANTYNGTTSISNSTVIILNNASALPSGNLSLTGNSILGLGTGNDSFTRALGTGTNQVQFTGGGGFAAFGGNKSVNLGGASATVTWNSGSFVPSSNNLTLSDINASGTLDFQNPINVNGVGSRIIVVPDGSAAIDAVLSGGVTDSGSGGSIRKNDEGTLQLVTANSYTGQTVVAGGVLRLDHADALPSLSALNLQGGGVLGLGTGHTEFTRTLGSGAGQVSTSGTGSGFSAYGGNKVVRFNNDADYTVVWGTSGLFNSNQLIFSESAADGMVDLQNKIDLNGAVRTIQARNGSAIVDGKLSGVISGTGLSGILKNNPGTLELSAANTYTGTTTVTAGVLLLTNASSIPGGISGGNLGNIIFGGTNVNNIGVLGLGQGNFTSGLGTGAGQVNLGTHAAFAAFYQDRFVNLGGSSAQVTWGSGSFVTGVLRLGDVVADKTVDFQNPIDLNGAVERTVSAANGTAAIMGVLSGTISGAGSLKKDGGGTLSLTGANTYDGGTSIIQGRLLVNNTTGSGVGTGDVTVSAGTLGGSGFIGTAGDSSSVTVNGASHVAPGNSAGALTVFGDVTFSASTTFFDVEIGGLTAGTDFDKLTVNGAASLNGTLTATLINTFMPVPGNSFEIISATGGRTGTFSTVTLPVVSGVNWQLVYNSNSVVLNARIPGDFNFDNTVDAGDYVVWRKTNGTQANYDLWRAHFGETVAAGSLSALHGVPEPATFSLLLLAAPMCLWRRRVR